MKLKLRSRLCIGVALVLMASVMITYVMGYFQRQKLVDLTNSMVPAAGYARDAVADFGRQIRQYEDAFSMGEAEPLKEAVIAATACGTGLDKLTKIQGLPVEYLKEARRIKEAHDAFTPQASTVYSALAAGDESGEAAAAAPEIAQKSNELKNAVEALSDSIAKRLGDELGTVNNDDKAILRHGMNIGIILVAVVIVYIVVTILVIKPLRRIMDAAGEFREGNFNYKLDYHSATEVGEVADALRLIGEEQLQKVEVARQIADGDLGCEAKITSEKDTLGKALNNMVRDLNTLVHDISNSADGVNDGSNQISDTSQALSQVSTEQAASVEEISSTLAEIAGQTRVNADNAEEASNLTHSARNAAQEGTTRMHEMVAAMDEITGSSAQIAKIIKVIDDIAFQTNLLALNAAVEAARAGRHGKGFAVVAEEVRNLAGRCAKAAQETTSLIEDSNSKVRNGSAIATSTSEALEKIVTGVVKANDLVQDITLASREQAGNIEQVNVGVGQIEQSTQENSARAEETASASVELRSLSEHLKNKLGRFNLRDSTSSVIDIPGDGADSGFSVTQSAAAIVPELAMPEQTKGEVTAW